MIFENSVELKERVEFFLHRPIKDNIPIIEDTSEYMDIFHGMVLRLEENDFLVTSNAYEGRAGLDDAPKYWVKYVIDLTTGERKILKLVFYEEFSVRFGDILIKNFRNPEKESSILNLVRGNPYFMQGLSVKDKQKNNVRILDFIKGPTLYSYITEIPQSHEEYFFKSFPDILQSIITSISAMEFLNKNGHHHGDICNDHIIIDKESGHYRWIDFDSAVNFPDYDIWSMGNILTYAVGKGIHSFHAVRKNNSLYPFHSSELVHEDACLFFRYRIVNLKKLFPYIPNKLNNILKCFSHGAKNHYENFQILTNDLHESLSLLHV